MYFMVGLQNIQTVYNPIYASRTRSLLLLLTPLIIEGYGSIMGSKAWASRWICGSENHNSLPMGLEYTPHGTNIEQLKS